MKDLSASYLKAIAEYGSISNAAKGLFISQPYLSKYIQRLEKELGVEVINRQSTPVTLTYAGERYLHYMDDVDDVIQTMLNEIHSISNLKKGRLKIGVSHFLSTYTLHQLLPDFMLRYPGIEIELVEDATETLEALLVQNQIDVCFNSLPITNHDILYEFLYDEYNYIVIPPNHPLSVNCVPEDEFDPAVLDGEKFIVTKPGVGLRRFTNQILAEYQIHPQIILETSNTENALRLANKGVAITIVPQCVIENASEKIEACLYPLKDPAFKSHIVLSYRKGAQLTPATLAFIELAREKFPRS
ncbi:LysR family transcriptional regulator [Sporosarcina saromensis]|uniref:LysR family transcriptional regulator n=1 Tax=Sporosarcina saromensis TaxID=359365 RepID=A0ABU4GBC2_9BACL|nr:LysR family transcriptional regulator [Sporosarcina saromensis]MDW0114298.1 LysR family transcriptional regulator [Sporosarcina saromensis]